MGISGTEFTLNYRSDRTPNRKAAYTLEISLSGPSIPTGLKRIDLSIQIAGRYFFQNFPANPNQKVTFLWDGQDVYGRTLQRGQPITVGIGYVYNAVYVESHKPGGRGLYRV